VPAARARVVGAAAEAGRRRAHFVRACFEKQWSGGPTVDLARLGTISEPRGWSPTNSSPPPRTRRAPQRGNSRVRWFWQCNVTHRWKLDQQAGRPADSGFTNGVEGQ
jgi:hypothetical protein